MHRNTINNQLLEAFYHFLCIFDDTKAYSDGQNNEGDHPDYK